MVNSVPTKLDLHLPIYASLLRLRSQRFS
jgi:hypothetical protein